MENTKMDGTEESELSLLRQRIADLEIELALAREASSTLFATGTLSDRGSRIVAIARRYMPAGAYGIWRRRRGNAFWIPIATEGLPEQLLNTLDLTSGEPVSYEDVEQESLPEPARIALHAAGIRSLLAMPLGIHQDGDGVLVICWHIPHAIKDSEVRLVWQLAGIASATLGNAEDLERLLNESYIVADGIPALVSYVDAGLRYRRVNRAYVDLFGLTREEMVGRHVEEIVGPERYQAAKPYLEQALRGQRIDYSSQVTGKDGKKRDIAISYTPDFAFDGTVRGIVVVAQDTTERNRADEQKARLAAIVDSSDDAIVSKTLAGVITSWNHGAERIFGYTAAEAIGQHMTLIIPPERRFEEDEVLARLRRGERIDHFETERVAKGGRLVLVSLTVSPVKDSGGRIIEASKTARDITAQRQLQARERKARETAEVLNRIAPMVTAELDPEKLTQKITDLATQAVRAEFGALFHNVRNENQESYVLYTLSGVPREAFANFPMPRNTEVFGPTFRGDGPVRSDDITKDPRYGKNAPHHGMPEGHLPVRSYLAVPVISRTGDVLGGLFFGHARTGVFGEEEEQIAKGIAAQAAVALDNAVLFSESQRAQRELSLSNVELKRANSDLNEFAHSASHDLQEPLRTISIFTQLLGRKVAGTLDPEGEEYLAHVLRGARRLETLVRDFLAYNQAAAISDEQPPVTDAGVALDIALSNLKATIEKSGTTIESGGLPSVRIRALHLTQVFRHLLGNAMKYRRDEPPRIGVRAERQGNEWLFSVEDNGIGIEDRYKEQVFGIFKRLHTADEHAGTGIGLAICRRIVERAAGRIWVESEPGRGSIFYFTLPAEE
jgi:PAS domain S-box-containing protein